MPSAVIYDYIYEHIFNFPKSKKKKILSLESGVLRSLSHALRGQFLNRRLEPGQYTLWQKER